MVCDLRSGGRPLRLSRVSLWSRETGGAVWRVEPVWTAAWSDGWSMASVARVTDRLTLGSELVLPRRRTTRLERRPRLRSSVRFRHTFRRGVMMWPSPPRAPSFETLHREPDLRGTRRWRAPHRWFHRRSPRQTLRHPLIQLPGTASGTAAAPMGVHRDGVESDPTVP